MESKLPQKSEARAWTAACEIENTNLLHQQRDASIAYICIYMKCTRNIQETVLQFCEKLKSGKK